MDSHLSRYLSGIYFAKVYTIVKIVLNKMNKMDNVEDEELKQKLNEIHSQLEKIHLSNLEIFKEKDEAKYTLLKENDLQVRVLDYKLTEILGNMF